MPPGRMTTESSKLYIERKNGKQNFTFIGVISGFLVHPGFRADFYR